MEEEPFTPLVLAQRSSHTTTPAAASLVCSGSLAERAGQDGLLCDTRHGDRLNGDCLMAAGSDGLAALTEGLRAAFAACEIHETTGDLASNRPATVVMCRGVTRWPLERADFRAPYWKLTASLGGDLGLLCPLGQLRKPHAETRRNQEAFVTRTPI